MYDPAFGSVVSTAIGAARHAVEFAISALHDVPQAEDADSWVGAEEGGEATNHLLDRLTEPPLDDQDWHLGDPASQLDVQAHRRMKADILDEFPRAFVAGEEATPFENHEAENAPPGSLVYLLDAIDGSEHADCFGFGFSSNVAAFEIQRDQSARLVCSLVVNSSRQCLGYSRSNGAFFGTVDDLKSTGDFNRAVDDERIVVSIVGAKPNTRYREAALSIMESTDFRVYTTGGAPMGPGMAMGRLDALVHPEYHPAWDATHLPALAALGGNILSLENGSLLFAETIARRMCLRRYQGDTGAKKVMPPTVIARNREVGEEIPELLT